MSYLDIGFDEFLNRIENQTPVDNTQQLDPLAFDTFTDEISGSKIQGGRISSPDGTAIFDLEEGVLKVSDGVVDLVQLGVLPDGSIGLRIQDSKGNILMQISEVESFIQSVNQHFRVDFDKEHILSRDDTATPRAAFGKLEI